jgi:hypothetical protein
MYKYFIVVLLAFLCKPTFSFSQNLDSLFYKNISSYAHEKVFVHFDKDLYASNETIWFKAYIFDGSLPTNFSTVLYLNWFAPNGDLLAQTTLPIANAVANGQFIIPKNYNKKNISVKAFTNWSLNFDSSFVFEKQLSIFDKNSFNFNQDSIKNRLSFFPEGGNLIEGFTNNLAFLASNSLGLPIDVKGVIKNSNNILIDSFSTTHNGMGVLGIQSLQANENYTAYWTVRNSTQPYITVLPKVEPIGVAMQVQQFGKKTVVELKKSKLIIANNLVLHLVATLNNEIVYHAILPNKNEASIHEINTNSFKSGVLQITILSSKFVPLSERIVFINNENFSTNIAISAKINANKKAKNTVTFLANDSLPCNMSLSIVDADVPVDTSNSILSYLMLTGQLKGRVYNANYYFNNSEDSIAQQLDLVMLTHGWRKYNWQQIAAEENVFFNHKPDTNFASIGANVFGVVKRDLLPNQQIIMFLETNLGIKKQLTLPYKKNNSFLLSGLLFYDTLKVYYNFLNNKVLNATAQVAFNNVFNDMPNVVVQNNDNKYSIFDDWAAQKKPITGIYANNSLSQKGALQDVIVRAKIKSKLDVLDEKYATALFAGGDALQFDIDQQTANANASLSILDYLRKQIPGLEVLQQEGETVVKWRKNNTNFFIDEMQQDVTLVETMNMNDVAYIKAMRPPFMGGSGGSAGGAVCIYTKNGNGATSKFGTGMLLKKLTGFSSSKEFYSPNYEQEPTINSDARTTLLWQPQLVINANNKTVSIDFFNNDFTKKMLLHLMGFSKDGRLISVYKLLQ